MMLERRPPDDEREREREDVEEIARDVGAHNPDPTTRREAIEQELMEEGKSEEGEELGE
jgi:hypothetical protein